MSFTLPETGQPWTITGQQERPVTRPWYGLKGHQPGLRANDPTALASAFMILAMEGGTAHLSHCDGIVGQGCGLCFGVIPVKPQELFSHL